MKIYLDTNIWNALCDQQVEPQALVRTLAMRNANLVVGLHVFYELTKTFRSAKKEAFDRGRHLFSYLQGFMEAGIQCVKENPELLVAEMYGLKFGPPRMEVFYKGADYVLIREGVDKLAEGGFDERARQFIEEQDAFAANIRLDQAQRLQVRPDARNFLKLVKPENLCEWLENETFGPFGIASLKEHILKRFPKIPEIEAMEYALALRSSACGRVARGFVRTCSYYMWRCACHESVPKDLFDDMYHVLNSAHCDVYVTEEERQLNYAPLLLSTSTRVAIYSRQEPIDQWLLNLD